MNGILIFDKPAGVTSHDVVAHVRRTLKQKKVGHTGTLDPFATGVLPIALGEATKIIPYLDESVKEYRAVMRLGISTDTQDYTGKELSRNETQHLTREQILESFADFSGPIAQIPPMFSAVKQGGIPLYKRARRGEEVERAPRQIVIHNLFLEHCNLPYVTFTVLCSRGTYVRTLANDIGEALGCGAHLVELRRTKSGIFTLEDAILMESLPDLYVNDSLSGHLVTPFQALSHLPYVTLSEEGAKKVGFGRSPSKTDYELPLGEELADGQSLCLVREDKLLAIGSSSGFTQSDQEKTISLLRVFS
jgi:tRNA pseudouridine55 synthase